MSADITVEKLITNAIHTAFIKYPEGDGGPNLDYEWIPPEQSSHITKAILLDLAADSLSSQSETRWLPVQTSHLRRIEGGKDRSVDKVYQI
jgi:hypothetical protein